MFVVIVIGRQLCLGEIKLIFFGTLLKELIMTLESLYGSHIWDHICSYLPSNSRIMLEFVLDKFEYRDLTSQEKELLAEPEEEEYVEDGYDKWDEMYDDDFKVCMDDYGDEYGDEYSDDYGDDVYCTEW